MNQTKTYTLRNTLGPLFLITCCPAFVMLTWYTFTSLNGSMQELLELILKQGLFYTIYQVWSPVFFGSKTAWTMFALFSILQLSFMKFLPGKPFYGPITPKGNIPVYKANGVLSFALTMLLFCLGGFIFKWFSPTIIYDHFGEILGALNLFSLFFCLLLLIKGYFIPSSTDSGSSKNLVFDYYWGTELYPRILGFDVKMFTNCRFALMGWGVILLSFAAKQQQLYGLSDSMIVSVVLQLLYITKFFIWETGYLSSLDIMHDRAGFYICWGCLVWVPGIYTSPTLYLVNHPNHLGYTLSFAILFAGTVSILSNYFADRQRQKVRTTQGNCKVWLAKPVIIQASYTTEHGEQKNSLLLASGFWGIARHFHYVPEILGAFFWTMPAFFDHILPYFYVIFLTILLVDRAYRDDERCARKYGKFWHTYCKEVPYKIIPYVI